MAASERFESRSHSIDGAVVRGVRVFIVDGLPNVALADNQLPPKNSEFEFNGVKGFLHSYSVERYGIAQSLVTCNYDNDGSSRGPLDSDPREDGYKDYNITQTRDTEKVPAFQLFHDEKNMAPDGATPVLGKVARWEPYEFITPKYSSTAEVTVNTRVMNSGVMRTIAAQTNALHTFPDGVQWLFVGASTRRQEASQWSITYRWLGDGGSTTVAPSPYIAPNGTPFSFTGTDFTLVPAGTLIVPAVARPPFWKYRAIPQAQSSQSNPGAAPSIGLAPSSLFYNIVPLGWQTLPGNPIP